jgi:predicted RNase H-like HicB family nuclease
MENMVRLTGIVEPEDGMFAAYCSELGTATCGDTLEEALKSSNGQQT